MLVVSTKKTSQNLPHIKVLAYVENWMNEKIWYTYIIRLDERYIKDDMNRMKDHLISHMPTISSVEIL